MIFRSAQIRKLAGMAAVLFFSLQARADPEAEAILEAARVNPLGEKIALDARLRAGNVSVPFRIVVDGTVRYQFDSPGQELILELAGDDSALSERRGGRATEVQPARYDERVRGSTITYEDLALKFLYWKKPYLLGEETIRSRPAWKIEVQAPRGGRSQYGVARLWIDKQSGALLRMEGYDMQGKLIRKFEIVSAQKLEGQWMLKQMRIETVDPATRSTTGRTYLEVLGKRKE